MPFGQRAGAAQRFLQNRSRLGVETRLLIELRNLLHPATETRRSDRRALQQGTRLLPRGGGIFERAVTVRLPDRLDRRVQRVLRRRWLRQDGQRTEQKQRHAKHVAVSFVRERPEGKP